MTLAELESALSLIVQDRSLESRYKAWINTAILELAADFELPALKLLAPTVFPITTATWIFNLPATFQKNLFRCADSLYSDIRVHRFADGIDALDIDHDETGDHVTSVAVTQAGQLAVFPKVTVAESIYLWYYKRPKVMVLPTDVPDLMPDSYHERVILPKCVIKAYEHLQDQVENFDPKGLQYWQGKFREGLYGSPMGPIGLINYLVKAQGGPRRHGGRGAIWSGGWYR